MSSIKLDLSKFKHVSSDGHSTTLKHTQDGHEITLAHKSLSPPNQQALAALAKLSANTATAPQAEEAHANKMAEGGKIPPKQTNPKLDESKKAPPKKDQIPWQNVRLYANGQQVQKMSSSDQALADASEFGRNQTQTNAGELSESDRESRADANANAASSNAMANPVPIAPSQASSSSQEVQTGGPTTTAGKLAPGFKQAVEGMAKGGKVPGACPMCGGGKAHYDGGGLASQSDVPEASDPNATPQQQDPSQPAAAQPADNTPDQMMEHNYNTMALAGLPEAAVQALTTTPQGRERLMENGKAGPKADPEALQIAEDATNNQIAQKQAEDTTKAAKFSKDNQLRAKFGMAQLPPQFAGMEQAPDTSGPNPWATAAGVVPAANPPSPDRSPSQVAPKQQEDNTSSNSMNPMGMYQQALDLGMQGIKGQARVQEQQGKQEADALKAQADNLKTAKDNFTGQYTELMKENTHLQQDVRDGLVNPEKFWTGDSQGNGSHSKLMSGLGMILAGFNPTSNPNAAINFLKFQMEQNIHAQATNLGAKQSLLAANLKQFGNLKDATMMTQLQLSNDIQNKLGMLAAKAKSQGAQYQAMQLQSQLLAQNAPIAMQLTARRTMADLNNSGGTMDPNLVYAHIDQMRQMGYTKEAEDYANRYVKGVGFAESTLPDSAKQYFASYHDTKSLLQRSMQMADASPAQKADPKFRSEAKALYYDTQASLRKARGDGVFKESEAWQLEKEMGPSPDSFLSSFTVSPKLKSIIQGVEQRYNDQLDTYNVKRPAQMQQQNQQAAPEVQTMGGKQYKRVQGGWAPL